MNLKNKRILVIGGAGFIGSHIVDQLLEQEVKEVIIFDNFTRGTSDNIKKALKDSRCKVYENYGDIIHEEILNDAMVDIDGVFHLAASWLLHCLEYPKSAFEVNVRGTFNVINAAIKNNVKKIIFSSSASVYGDAQSDVITEDHPYNNNTFYGATKIAGEHFFHSLCHKQNIDWLGLRYMNVYGPRQDYKGTYIAVIHKILDRLEADKNPIIFGDGQQCYDFVYVEDVAKANILAMQSDKSGKCYNVGTGIGTALKDLTILLLKLTNKDLEIQYEKAGLTFVTKRIGCSIAANKDLGFIYKTSLEKGLNELIRWRKKEKANL